MIRSKASAWPPHRYVRKFHRRVLEFRDFLSKEIQIADGKVSYRFRCESVREFNRCLKFFSKEPGTYSWIKNNVRAGEVFCDIGANIGIYTILAARCTGASGKVYAFEPHSANFSRLLDNIAVNELERVVIPCNFALHAKKGLFPFDYASSKAGTSNSQLADENRLAGGEPHSIRELKWATTIDDLLAEGAIVPPNHVKIDVDGNELAILSGMARLLGGSSRPRFIQVEMNEPNKAAIQELMRRHSYGLLNKHYTRSTRRRMEEEGADPGAFNYNALFQAL